MSNGRGRDDPRVGGGAALPAPRRVPTRGRSPRGRGSQRRGRAGLQRRGTIPAWAGEPTARISVACLMRDDPRVGGGADVLDTELPPLTGRSPRGRGSPWRNGSRRALTGTIPAWAGEPPWPAPRPAESGDDPRVGGGARMPSFQPMASRGRSPRGRGSPPGMGLDVLSLGTIPAWAGEPGEGTQCACRLGDDPRVGGGARDQLAWAYGAGGRSPRGRGSRGAGARRRLEQGTIPAWAGEPRSRWPAPAQTGDDPRVGGGAYDPRMPGEMQLGRSPRGRGSQFAPDRDGALLGTIPAWAGEP